MRNLEMKMLQEVSKYDFSSENYQQLHYHTKRKEAINKCRGRVIFKLNLHDVLVLAFSQKNRRWSLWTEMRLVRRRDYGISTVEWYPFRFPIASILRPR